VYLFIIPFPSLIHSFTYPFRSLSKDRSITSSKTSCLQGGSNLSSFNFHYPLLPLRISSSCIRLITCLSDTSTLPSLSLNCTFFNFFSTLILICIKHCLNFASGGTNPTSLIHIPEELHLQQHRWVNFKFRVGRITLVWNANKHTFG